MTSMLGTEDGVVDGAFNFSKNIEYQLFMVSSQLLMVVLDLSLLDAK